MSNPIIYILTDFNTSRLKYVLDVIFSIHLRLEYVILDSINDYPTASILINFTSRRVSYENIAVRPSRLLSEDTIYAQNISIHKNENGLPYYFTSYEYEGDYIFDLFALVFYQLSRYEEYLRFTPDKYGRFSADKSLAHRNDFIQIPIVDIWILHLKKSIEEKWNTTIDNRRNFSIHPTIDIDTPYAFVAKPFHLHVIAFFRDVFLLRATRIRERLLTLIGRQEDAFDTYASLLNLLENYGLKATFFFLMKFHLPDDQNFSINSQRFITLVRNLSSTSDIGIHPSLHSNGIKEKIKGEKGKLSTLTVPIITKSRQHFLKLEFPKTYRTLIDLDITEEYSMGFHDRSGFRAGTSISYPWFDLQKNEKTKLILRPFQIMDATLRHHQNMDPDEAIQEVNQIKSEVSKVGGEFRFIWHNSSFAEIYGWKGWDEVLKSCLS